MHSIAASGCGRRPRWAPILLALVLAPAVHAARQDPTAPSAPVAPPAKPKKVWTNDDMESATTSLGARQPVAASPAKSTDANAQLAGQLRSKLLKLQGQLQDTEKQLNELKSFQAGEGNGNAARQLHKGYNSEPIPEQIQKLEEKRQQLAAQIDALYDEARKKGILPGQLR